MEKQNYVLTYSIDWMNGEFSYGIADYECYSIRYPFENMSEKIAELEEGIKEEHTIDKIKEISIHIRNKKKEPSNADSTTKTT